jgi:hypothetical protein
MELTSNIILIAQECNGLDQNGLESWENMRGKLDMRKGDSGSEVCLESLLYIPEPQGTDCINIGPFLYEV